MSPFKTLGGLSAALLLLSAAPAYADDDRFSLRLGAVQAEARTQLRASTEFDGSVYDYTSERFDLGDDTVPRIEGMFRLGERHRLLFNYLRYERERSAELREPATFGDFTFPAGSSAEASARFDLASLVYDFAVVETPNLSLGLQIGAERAEIEGRLSAQSGEERFDSRAREDGMAPVVGARLQASTADDRWRFVVQGQYLDAKWGDFEDYEGSLSRANALVEYRFTPRVGVFAGYDWFRLDVDRTKPERNYGVDLRFQGPMAGLTLAF